jgi:hypothetical protein
MLLSCFDSKGVTFRDVCPLFEDPRAFRGCIDLLRERYSSYQFDVVAGNLSFFAVGNIDENKMRRGS